MVASAKQTAELFLSNPTQTITTLNACARELNHRAARAMRGPSSSYFSFVRHAATNVSCSRHSQTVLCECGLSRFSSTSCSAAHDRIYLLRQQRSTQPYGILLQVASHFDYIHIQLGRLLRLLTTTPTNRSSVHVVRARPPHCQGTHTTQCHARVPCGPRTWQGALRWLAAACRRAP